MGVPSEIHMATATCSAAAEAEAGTAPLSKNALKKQAQMQYKRQMKAMHHAKAHSSMRNDAQRLRAHLLRSIIPCTPNSPSAMRQRLAAIGSGRADLRLHAFRGPSLRWVFGECLDVSGRDP